MSKLFFEFSDVQSYYMWIKSHLEQRIIFLVSCDVKFSIILAKETDCKPIR